MDSMITLGIERMELDWGKNSLFTNHSALFQSSDLTLIPYYYINDNTDEPIIELKEGYAKKLKDVKPRLELLGYDLHSIREMFNTMINEVTKHDSISFLTFDIFFKTIKSIDISKFDTVSYEVDGYDNGYDLGEYVRKCIIKHPDINRNLLVEYQDSQDAWNDPFYHLSYFLEHLDSYITLRILAENPKNAELLLQWNFIDAIDNGWVTRSEIVKSLDESKKVLIVTEGSSDSFIIKKTFKELYPNISDFFYFIDMTENYPFTGVGNLYNFCAGLCKINIQNNIIFVFDNDTAGVEKFNKAVELKRPKTFLICKLPSHSQFDDMHTIGPQGDTKENVNGKAVSIECFLDFQSLSDLPPEIRWTTYNKNEKQYQGELNKKDEYVRVLKKSVLSDVAYDTSKLEFLADHLIESWINRNRT